MRLKEIKEGMVVHCRTQEDLKMLSDVGISSCFGKRIDEYMRPACFVIIRDNNGADWTISIDEALEYGEITEFSDLIITELTAAELLDTIKEICKNYSCFACPLEFNSECMIGAERIDKNAVIEICEKWKSDHETKKKEPEVEWVWETYIFGSYDHNIVSSEEEAIKWCEQFVKEHPDKRCYYRRICRVKR